MKFGWGIILTVLLLRSEHRIFNQQRQQEIQIYTRCQRWHSQSFFSSMTLKVWLLTEWEWWMTLSSLLMRLSPLGNSTSFLTDSYYRTLLLLMRAIHVLKHAYYVNLPSVSDTIHNALCIVIVSHNVNYLFRPKYSIPCLLQRILKPQGDSFTQLCVLSAQESLNHISWKQLQILPLKFKRMYKLWYLHMTNRTDMLLYS